MFIKVRKQVALIKVKKKPLEIKLRGTIGHFYGKLLIWPFRCKGLMSL